MKKIFFLLLATITHLTTNAQFETAKQIYSSNNLNTFIRNAKKIAILPFNSKISFKKMPKGVTYEMIKDEEKQSNYQLQDGMFTYLLRKSNDYTVSFQDVNMTNAILRKNNIDDINIITPDSLCKILNVDGIIKCNWSYEKTGSEAGAIAAAALFGVSKATASGSLVMQIYSATDGELIWRFYKEMNETAFSNASALMERMMRKVGRNFPLEKNY
jgi:hypothetical protein